MTDILLSATKDDGEDVFLKVEFPEDFQSWSMTEQFICVWREAVGAFHSHDIKPWRILAEDVTDKTWDDETGTYK